MIEIDNAKRGILFGGLALAAAGYAGAPAVAAPRTSGSQVDMEAVKSLVCLERYYRDQLQFDELARCYASDSRVHVSWFKGTGAQFAEASRNVAANGIISFHQITPMRVEVSDDRAVVESYGAIICPNMALGGTIVASVSYSRFLSCLRRTVDGWRMVTFDCIYQGDFMMPVQPGATIALTVDLSLQARWPYRCLAAIGKANGYKIDPEMAGIDRPDLVQKLMTEAQGWLATGELA